MAARHERARYRHHVDRRRRSEWWWAGGTLVAALVIGGAALGLGLSPSSLPANNSGGQPVGPQQANATHPVPIRHSWQSLHTAVDPGSAIRFDDPSTGWRVGGLGGAPGIDGNLAAAPLDTGFDWPGTSVWRTTDGGRSWTVVLDGLSPGLQGVWSIDPLSPRAAWAIGVLGIERTVDAGRSWSRVPEPPGLHLVTVDFTTSNLGWGLATNGTVVRTVDGGETWARIPLPLPATSLCLARGVAYVADEDAGVFVGGLLGSAPHLATRLRPLGTPNVPAWTQISCSGRDAWVSATFTSLTSHDEASVRYQVVATGDGGASWRSVARNDGGGLDPPGAPRAVAVTTLSTTDSDGPFLLGFPVAGWRVEVGRVASGRLASSSTIPTLPHAPDRAQASAYALVQGAARVGRFGWVQITDDSPMGAPVTYVLETGDAGAHWQIVNRTGG